MATGTIHIGTAGWHYPHWSGPFYPPELKPDGYLDYYARRFATVEINNTFYRLPARATLRDWSARTPAGFVFACKASRYITHMKKLKDPADSTKAFFAAVTALGGKLGPVLFQLPPRWHADTDRLTDFLAALPRRRRYVFEFRDDSWFRSDVYDALARRNAALCAYDLGGRRSPVVATADFAYVRLHGPGDPYQGAYDGRTLAGWARRFKAWRAAGTDVYCYFDNDEGGDAARDARRLIDMIG